MKTIKLMLIVIWVTVLGGVLSASAESTADKSAESGETAVGTPSEPAETKTDTPPKTAKKDDVVWHGYDEGVSLGKKENKKIFLNFYADWCHYCKVMESKTFKDRSVSDFLNDNFVAIRVNSDKNKKLSQKFNVRGLPSNWFLTEDGQSIGSQPGYVPPEMMIQLLKYIHTDSYKKMNFKKFQDTL